MHTLGEDPAAHLCEHMCRTPSCDASDRSWCKGIRCVMCSLGVDRSLAFFRFFTIIEKQWPDSHPLGVHGSVIFLRGLPQLPSLHFNVFFTSFTGPKRPEPSEEKLVPTWSLIFSTSRQAKSGCIYWYGPSIWKYICCEMFYQLQPNFKMDQYFIYTVSSMLSSIG